MISHVTSFYYITPFYLLHVGIKMVRKVSTKRVHCFFFIFAIFENGNEFDFFFLENKYEYGKPTIAQKPKLVRNFAEIKLDFFSSE